VKLNLSQCPQKHLELILAGQAPSHLKPQADEKPFPEIYQLAKHTGWESPVP